MNSGQPDHSAEERLNEIIASFLEAERGGNAVNQEDWLQNHPEFAKELKSFFANRAEFQAVAGHMDTPTIPPRADVVQDSAIIMPSDANLPSETTAPRNFGDYELLEEIARGGMGVVYRARQVSLNRIIALKMILSGQLASQDDVQRFRREAEAAANLDHPNIVPINEVGEHEKQHYFSMKLIEGGALNQHLPRYVSDQRAAAELMMHVARAVHHAHQRGILHRDLKPGNILIDSDGKPHVTDFGLAKRMASLGRETGEALTHSGAIVGTPSYMAPEQARGEKGLSTAVDVYSLGAILYELLTGKPPFQAETPLDIVLQVLEREPAAPRSLNPQVNRDLETICLKCLAKDPGQRYRSALDVVEELERWLRGEPITARPAGRWERTWRWCRRNPALTALAATLLIGTIVSVSLAVWALGERNRADRNAFKASENAKREKEKAAAEAKERKRANHLLTRMKRQLYTGQLLRVAGIYERDPWQGIELLHDYNICPIDQRDAAWHFYHNAAKRWHHGEVLYQIALPGLPRLAPYAFGPEGSLFLATFGVDNWELWKLGRTHQKTIVKCPYPLTISWDGKLLAGGSGKGIWVYDVAKKDYVARQLEGSTRRYRPRFGPRNNVLFGFWRSKDKMTVKVWDLRTKKESGSFECDMTNHGGRFSPDGKLFARYDDRTITLWNVATWRKQANVGNELTTFGPVAFSPDSRTLAYGRRDGTVGLWDIEKNQERSTFLGHRDLSSTVEFSHDGSRLVSGSRKGEVHVWEVATGSLLARRRPPHLPINAYVTHVALLPGGKLLASVMRRGRGIETRVWDLTPTSEHATLSHDDVAKSVLFSANSATMVVRVGGFGKKRTLKLWNVRTGKAFPDLRGPISKSFNMRLSADGRTLALTNSNPTQIDLYDVISGKHRKSKKLPGDFDVPSPHRDTAVTHARQLRLVSGRHDAHEILVSDVNTQQIVFSQTVKAVRPDQVRVALSNDRTLVGVVIRHGATTSRAHVWEVQSGKILFADEVRRVSRISFSGDNQTMILHEPFRRVELWDLPTKKKLAEIDGKYFEFSPDGRTCSIRTEDGALQLVDTTSGQVRAVLKGHGQQFTSFSPDGSFLAAYGGDRTVKLWHVGRGSHIATFEGRHCTCSADGKTFAHISGSARIVDTTSGQERYQFDFPGKILVPGKDGGDPVFMDTRFLVFSPDCTTLATVYQDHTATLWDLEAKRKIASIGTALPKSVNVDNVRPLAPAFSPDGRTFVLGRWRRDDRQSFELWDAATGKKKVTLEGTFVGEWTTSPNFPTFSPDGKIIGFIDRSDNKRPLVLWDTATGRKLPATRFEHRVAARIRKAFSPNGKFCATTEFTLVKLWNSKTGKQKAVLKGHDRLVSALAFSPDGKTLATASNEWILFWDLATGKERDAIYCDLVYDPYALAFTPDGKKLISTAYVNSYRQKVNFWNVPK